MPPKINVTLSPPKEIHVVGSAVIGPPGPPGAGVGEPPPHSYAVNRAVAFIESMMENIETPQGASTIKADRDYPSTFSGPCNGSFALRDDPPPEIEGVVLGTVQGVRYRDTDRLISTSYIPKHATSESDINSGADRPTVPVIIEKFADQTTVVSFRNLSGSRPLHATRMSVGGAYISDGTVAAPGATGTLTLTGPNPEWIGVHFEGAPGHTAYGDFDIKVDTSANLAGAAPGSGTFVGYKVEAHIIVDTDYKWAEQDAKVDGTFSFPYLNPGIRRFLLRRTSDNAIMADTLEGWNNVRSYLVNFGQPGYGTNFVNQSYMYDQAVALLATIAAGRSDLAQRLAQGMLHFQTKGGTHDGGLIFSATQNAPGYGDAAYRTGAHAIGTYALLSYMSAFPSDQSRDFGDAVDRAVTWLQQQLNPTFNLVTGGWGVYSGDPQVFDPAPKLDWMSIEHNFDAYHTFKLADIVRGGYATIGDTIGEAIQTTLWDAIHGRFYQGMKDDGTPDTADPLDAHSWGAIFCTAHGDLTRAKAIMTASQLAPFANTQDTPEGIEATGYAVNYDEPGYPGALPNVWSEGTFGVAYAFKRMGDDKGWRETMDGLVPSQAADGSYYYVTNDDPTQEIFTYRSTVGAAWSVLAALGHGIWGVPSNR